MCRLVAGLPVDGSGRPVWRQYSTRAARPDSATRLKELSDSNLVGPVLPSIVTTTSVESNRSRQPGSGLKSHSPPFGGASGPLHWPTTRGHRDMACRVSSDPDGVGGDPAMATAPNCCCTTAIRPFVLLPRKVAVGIVALHCPLAGTRRKRDAAGPLSHKPDNSAMINRVRDQIPSLPSHNPKSSHEGEKQLMSDQEPDVRGNERELSSTPRLIPSSVILRAPSHPNRASQKA